MKSAITLIELLVVIALVGIIAGVGWPSLGGWNCRQDLRNEFENFNNYMRKVQSESVSSNKTTKVATYFYQSPFGGGGTYNRAFLHTEKTCSSSGRSQIKNSYPIVIIPLDIEVLVDNTPVKWKRGYQCFYPDGSATANNYQFSKLCGGKKYLYKTQFFGATGLIEKLKYNYTSSTWDDI